jgi:NADPH-dependent ferric siderophore reductase
VGEGRDSVAELMAAAGDSLLAQINEDYAGSLLLVGRILGDRRDADGARLVGIDRLGVDLVMTEAGVEHAARAEFATPVDDADRLTRELFALVMHARSVSGEEGDTEVERIEAERARIRTFVARVSAVEDVHPHLRRITFAGGDLATFDPAGPDTFLYLLLPPPGRTELTIDASFSWEAHARMPEAEKPVGAYYTLRAWRPEREELDILVVLHGDAGNASRWAARAGVGDPVALWGPRTAYHPPPGTTHLVLVADETALPAVAVILEQLPAGMTAEVLAEVASEDERQPLPARPGVDVRWLHRDGAEPGTTTLLADAVRALPELGSGTYVWGGGESRVMTSIRRHVRDERGLDRERVGLVAYWRRA